MSGQVEDGCCAVGDVKAYGEGGGGTRRWGVDDVDRVGSLFDDKVVDQGAVGEDGLGPDSAPPLFEVARFDLRYELLH